MDNHLSFEVYFYSVTVTTTFSLKVDTYICFYSLTCIQLFYVFYAFIKLKPTAKATKTCSTDDWASFSYLCIMLAQINSQLLLLPLYNVRTKFHFNSLLLCSIQCTCKYVAKQLRLLQKMVLITNAQTTNKYQSIPVVLIPIPFAANWIYDELYNCAE